MSSVDRAPISMGNSCNYCIIHTRFQASINAQSNKTEQSIYECLLGFCLTTSSALPQILARSTALLLPNSRNEEMIRWLPWCYCCRFVLNSKRLLSTSCTAGPAEASSIFFMVLFPMLFEVRRIVCVEN